MTKRLKELFALDGRVAVITGGSRGLGLQVADALGEFGARIILVSRKQADLEVARAELASTGALVDIIAADLSDPADGHAVAEEILRRHGRIDILVNNAGATWGAPAEDYPLDAWEKVFNLNVTGLFALSQKVARDCFLPRERGVIINLASTEGLQAHHSDRLGTIAYNATKGAVINLTRALAAEWGPRGIRVNAIAPGFFPSKMTVGTLAEWEGRMVHDTPLRKLDGPNDLKGLALLLASDAGGHITGQTIVVDGGAIII